MKNVTEDRGIKIDTKVLEMLEKAGSNAGSFRKLAKLCGISPVSISRWQGKVANQTVECIDWTSWEKLWGYLTKHDIIDPADVRWMPPTVLRDALASGKIKAAHSPPTGASVNGHGVILAGGDANGNHITLPPGACAGEIEAFRSGLIMELIELEIEMTAKDAVLRLVRNFRRRA